MPRPASTTDRGYGWQHQKTRQQWAPRVDAGQVDCARCGRPIPPGTQWDLGHDDHDRRRYTGPEHQTCNRTAGARRGARITNARRRYRQTIPTSQPAARWRPCVICGRVYRARYDEQRACSPACGLEVRKRNRPPGQPRRAGTPDRSCSECAATFTPRSNRQLTCGPTCAEERSRKRAASRYRTDPEYHAKVLAAANQRNTERRLTQPPTATRW
jgi:hypothetical protein